jgi:hypothetical protein
MHGCAAYCLTFRTREPTDTRRWVVEEQMAANRVLLRLFCASTLLSCVMFGGVARAAILQELQFEGRTYYLLASKWWHESEQEAVSLGGHLVTIDSVAEHNFIYNNFGPTALANAPTSGKVNLWMGLCDPLMDQNYEWCDGAAIDYLNFFPDQPQRNHSDEMFMGIRVRGSNSSVPVGKWIDIVSDTRLGDLNFGVVEVVPEPSLVVMMIGSSACAIAWMIRQRSRRNYVLCPLKKHARVRRQG